MKQFYLNLTLMALTQLMVGQSFDMSLTLLGTNDDTGNYEVVLWATPNFTETDGNSADIGVVLSMSDNIFLQTGSTGFVNECASSGPPLFETTCEYLIEKEEWDASFLTDPSNNSPGRFVYQLLRTETGEATFFDAMDSTPVILAVFQIYNTASGLPSSGDITLVDNMDAVLIGTPNASFLNIRYDMATGGVTTDLFNAHDSSANTINFGTLSAETDTLSEMSLFPNPTDGIVNLKSGQHIDKVDIYTLNGQLVTSIQNENDTNQFDISALQAGIYFANLQSALGNKTIKLIKN